MPLMYSWGHGLLAAVYNEKQNERMFNQRLNILYFFILAIAFTLISCSNEDRVKTIKLAHGLDITHSVHKGMVFLAEKVAEKSGGRLQVEIYPNQQLGTERQCLELLQIGSLGMTKVSGAVLESFAPKAKVLSLPYVFKNKQHSYDILDGAIGREILIESEKYWLRGLCYYDAGSRSFYTKEKPINTPDDLGGLKIRVQESATAMKMVRNLGGAPTPIPWGEIYTSLQQGMVDGAENNPPSFYLSRHYEVCKYYCLNEHTAVPDLLIISTIIWNKLSPEEQGWLQEAANESVVLQRKLWDESEQEALKAVEAAGVEIIRPDKTPFIDKVQTLLEEYKEEPEVYSLIQRIQDNYHEN